MTPSADYRQGVLCIEAVPLLRLASGGTPALVHSDAAITDRLRAAMAAAPGDDPLICLPVGQTGPLAIGRTLVGLGAGAAVASLSDLRRAQAAGFPADRIIASAPVKEPEFLAAALDAGVGAIVVRRPSEMRLLADLASALAHVAPVIVPLTGEMVGLALTLPSLTVAGGLLLKPPSSGRMLSLWQRLRAAGHRPDRLLWQGRAEAGAAAADFAKACQARLVLVEPPLPPPVLICRVLETGPGGWVALDCPHDLLTALPEIILLPALAGAEAGSGRVQGVGGYREAGKPPVCRTAPLSAGDVVAILLSDGVSIAPEGGAGPYQTVPELLVKEGAFAVIKPKSAVTEGFSADRFPDWLESAPVSGRIRAFGTL